MSETFEHVPEIDALAAGAAVSGYVIRRMLGHGGFGITYEAQHRVTRRHFAIKEFFPSSMARRDGQSRLTYAKTHAETIEWALRKFEETTTTLCDLSHPNIVEVHDYVPANNTGYMVMELLRGLTLKQWLEARVAPPRIDELRPLVDPVIAALVYVHGRGLIHRDIAPDNILITEHGRPVLIDFGSVSRDFGDARHQSVSGTQGLTKRHYTAPEQMRAKSKPTPEADIYSMGAVLYRALTGADPMDGFDRVLAGTDPMEPLANGRPAGCPPHAAQAIDRALALRPDSRFKTMAELGESLAERPSGPPAPRLREGPELVGVFPVVEAEAPARPSVGPPAAAQRDVMQERTRRWVLGGLGGGAVAVGAAVLVSRETSREAAERRAAEQRAAAERRARGPLLRTFTGHTGPVRSVAFAPDGRTALSGSWDHTLKLWDIASGEALKTFNDHTAGVSSVAIAPDGRTALSGSYDKTLKLWDLAGLVEREPLKTLSGHRDDVLSVAIAPDGHAAASVSRDRTLKLWDLAGGLEPRISNTLPAYFVGFVPDGRTALSAGESGLKLWELASGKELRTVTSEARFSAAIAPDGQTALAATTLDTVLDLWDLASGRKLRTLTGHSGNMECVAFAPDGKTALSGSHDKTVKLWDVASGRELRTFTGHASWVSSVTFAPDGRTALSASFDQTLKLWDLT